MAAERKDGEVKPFSKMNKAELLEACKIAGVNPPADATNKALAALLEADVKAKAGANPPADANAEAIAQAEKLEADAKAKVEKDSKDKAKVDAENKEKADAEVKAEAEAKKGYFIAEGKSLIAGKKGMFDAGSKITAEDLGGEDNLKRHVENGNVVKVG